MIVDSPGTAAGRMLVAAVADRTGHRHRDRTAAAVAAAARDHIRTWFHRRTWLIGRPTADIVALRIVAAGRRILHIAAAVAVEQRTAMILGQTRLHRTETSVPVRIRCPGIPPMTASTDVRLAADLPPIPWTVVHCFPMPLQRHCPV